MCLLVHDTQCIKQPCIHEMRAHKITKQGNNGEKHPPNVFKQHRRLVHKHTHAHQIKRANTITIDDVQVIR